MPTVILSAVAYGWFSGLVGGGVLGAIVGSIAAAGVAYLAGQFFYGDQKQRPLKGLTQDLLTTARDPIAPWTIVYGQTRVGGTITFMEASSDKRYLHMVITMTGHVVDQIVSVYIDDQVATLDGNGYVTSPSKYANPAAGITSSIRIKLDDGSTAWPSNPFPDLISESTEWNVDWIQTGRAKMYVRLEYYQDDFPNGVPKFTALIKGKKVYDPRSGLTQWSDNPALCVADYLTDATYGVGASYADEINEDALIAAANTCEEPVTLDAGGTEDRYTCNGAFFVDGTPEDVLPQLLSSMSGNITYVSGRWKMRAGVYVSPVLELTDADFRGPIKITSLISKRGLFNSVRGEYVSPDNLYQPSDYPALSVSAYVVEDNNETIWQQIDLPFTQSPSMAQRIARIELRKIREQLSIAVPLKMGAYQLVPGDTFYLTVEKYGWSQKIFEIAEMGFAVDDNGSLGVNITARETNSTIYDWTATDEQAVSAGVNTNLPDPFTVAAPGAPVVVEQIYNTIESAGVKALANITWVAPSDYFAKSGLAKYQFEYKTITTSSWIVHPDVSAESITLYDLEPATYDFRVLARSVAGVKSDYSGTTRQQIVGLTAPPSVVNSFSVHPVNGLAQFTWALHADLDVRIGGKIEVRHSLSNSSYTWSDTALIGQFDGLATGGFGPLIAGTYIAKARDTVNVYSNSPAPFYVDDALITGYTTVASIVEHTTFVGTKENLSLVSGAIELTFPTSRSGTYYFPGSTTDYPTYVDIGSKAVRRFESDLQVKRFDAGDLIDDRAEVDTWPSIDGGNVDRGDVTMFVRMTDDDPSGAPTWSNWSVFRVAELNCRAAQFKLEYLNEQDTHNLSVTELAVHVKVPA